jgi:hypothetical protein
MEIRWTDYMHNRARMRGFARAGVEQILRLTSERYFDTATRRQVAIGRLEHELVMIPYDQVEETITPVTIHATTRQHITARLRAGRCIL